MGAFETVVFQLKSLYMVEDDQIKNWGDRRRLKRHHLLHFRGLETNIFKV